MERRLSSGDLGTPSPRAQHVILPEKTKKLFLQLMNPAGTTKFKWLRLFEGTLLLFFPAEMKMACSQHNKPGTVLFGGGGVAVGGVVRRKQEVERREN